MKHFLFSGAHPDGKPWQSYIVCFISNSGQHKNSNTRRYSPNSDTSLAHLPHLIRLPLISHFFWARNFNCCCAFPRCLIVCSLHSSTRVQHLNGTTLNTALPGKKIWFQNLHLISIFVSNKSYQYLTSRPRCLIFSPDNAEKRRITDRQ